MPENQNYRRNSNLKNDMRFKHIDLQGYEVRTKLWLEKDGHSFMGKGKAELLRKIEQTGSIKKAAKNLDMSYRHAWSLIKAAEAALERPLLEKIRGGKKGGGAILTPIAEKLLQKFENSSAALEKFTKDQLL